MQDFFFKVPYMPVIFVCSGMLVRFLLFSFAAIPPAGGLGGEVSEEKHSGRRSKKVGGCRFRTDRFL